MARRIIATAEVQVTSDVAKAEAGLDGLSESFRSIGADAERAAQRAEAAMFGGAKKAAAGFDNMRDAVDAALTRMAASDAVAREMANGLRVVFERAEQIAAVDIEQGLLEMLRVLKQVLPAAEAVDEGLHDVAVRAKLAAEAAEQIAIETKQAERRAERLGRAFRDVGQDIDVAMAGGMEGIEESIRDTIRTLNKMGGEFRDVAIIGAQAFGRITAEAGQADASIEDIVGSLRRLDRQLQAVEDDALRKAAQDAERLSNSLDDAARSAQHLDRRMDAVSGVTRRTSGDVRGLIALLGTAGLGYSFLRVGEWGLEMTMQLERSEAAFIGLTGSVEGANELLQKMVVFARETPYNLGNVTEAAAQLLAVGDGFGVTADNVEDYLTSLGNAIAITGGGQEQFTRLVRVLGQMSSTGKVLGQDMNQLAQNLPGYDVWQALADGAGTSVEELRRLQDAGKLDELLTGNEAVNILLEGINKIPGAAGAMERRMNTLQGALEKFQETAQYALSQGMEPFAETAQDVLSDPVILNSVEGLANAFGDLASSSLQEIAPELDDLAAAAEHFIEAMDEWAPVLGHVVDILGDFLNFAAPIVGKLGELADAALSAGDGLGKLAISAGLFMAGGPIGIGLGLLTAVSGAMDLFTGDAERAANMARLLAAAQGEVNAAMAVGEEVVYSEAQQLAIDSAKALREDYGELANAMVGFGVTVGDLQVGMEALASGTGEVPVALQEMLDYFNDPDVDGDKIISQFEGISEAYKTETDVMSEAAKELADDLALSGADIIGAMEEEQAEREAQAEAVQKYWEERSRLAKEGSNEVVKSEEDIAEAIERARVARIESINAYQEWKDGINEATRGVEASFSSLIEEEETTLAQMRENLRINTMEQGAWKDDLATIMAELTAQGAEFGPEFAGWLAEAGLGGQEMVDELANSPEELQAVYDEWVANTEQANRDVVGEAEALGDELYRSMLASARLGGDGFVQGIREYISQARAAVSALAGVVPDTVRGDLDMRSPSRVMWELGEYVVEGLIGGLQSLDAEAYAAASQTASMLSGGIEDHFRDADDPREEARKFAEDIAETIIEELIAEQEAVADAAEALAEAAADRLAEAWDRVKDRFRNRDIREAIDEAKAELAEAKKELGLAEFMAGAGGREAEAKARKRLADAEAALARAEAIDDAADLVADKTLTDFRRQTEDLTAQLKKSQEDEIKAIEAKIATATRNLDPVARAAAEAELAAAKERHAAEKTALDRRREDEEDALRRRLDAENEIREATIKARQDEAKALEKALTDVVKAIQDAIENLPDLRADVADAERDVQEAFMDQFEAVLENLTEDQVAMAAGLGAQAGLTKAEYDELIYAALAANDARRRAEAASTGVDDLLSILSSGFYTIGADGALGIAAGLSDGEAAIARALFDSVQAAINASLAALKISSPSKVTADLIGEPMAEGIAAGLTATVPEVSYAMTSLLDNVVRGVAVPAASQLVDSATTSTTLLPGFNGPLVSMPGAIIQDATDADLVAQRVVVALGATGVL